MDHNEYCGTCHPEKMPDHTHSKHKHKTKNQLVTFDRMMPVMLGVLVIVSMVQTMELNTLKDSITANSQEKVASKTSQPPVTQPATQAGNLYQGLPSQVGGC